jgi:SSS family solute:Na+ symporter
LKTILAIFWIGLYVFVNLTSVLYLGGLALETILGIELIEGVIGLALFAAAYSLYGGLSAVAWTDIIQVIVLVIGGLTTSYLALNTVSGGEGMFSGLYKLYEVVPDKFDMILERSNPEYINLPGISVLIGGMWVANLYYWGFNQYIIQRTLAAKSLKESQKGILFAACLKMILPLIIVIPGIAAYVIVNDSSLLSTLGETGLANMPTEGSADKAYPWLMQFLPTGLKGIAVAALAAAIVSSLASMLNSTATIFTLDIYKPFFDNNANESKTVNVGRISAAIALIIATIMAPFLGGIDQAFQFIQEYTGVVSPGILAVFILGLFWKKTSNKGAIVGALFSIPIAMFLKIGPKGWFGNSILNKAAPNLPFIDQMAVTAILTMIVIVIVSYYDNKEKDDIKGIKLEKDIFNTSSTFNIGSFALMIILTGLYSFFW